jgi:hypothetical protein
LREEVARLQAEMLELKQALAASQKEAKEKAELAKLWEKDWCEICALLPEELRIDPDEIAAMRKNGISFEELVEEIERDWKAHEEAGNAWRGAAFPYRLLRALHPAAPALVGTGHPPGEEAGVSGRLEGNPSPADARSPGLGRSSVSTARLGLMFYRGCAARSWCTTGWMSRAGWCS